MHLPEQNMIRSKISAIGEVTLGKITFWQDLQELFTEEHTKQKIEDLFKCYFFCKVGADLKEAKICWKMSHGIVFKPITKA